MNDFEIKKDILGFKDTLNLLLKSDFLIYDNKNKKNSQYKYFDLHNTIMNIKELTRNLEEVKRNKEGKVFMYIENRYLKSVANLILSEIGTLSNSLVIINSPKEIKKSLNELHLLIVLGKSNKKFVQETIMNNLFMIHFINDSIYQPISGAYNMSNKISTVNKLVFLFALIDKVLKENKSI